MTFAWYLVEGLNPEPWAASLASVGQKGGKPYVQFYKPEPLRIYQEAFKDLFVKQNPQAVEEPGEIQLWFYFWRQLSLNEMFEGRDTRSHVADATNLQKSTEDALQGILFANDRSVRHVRSSVVEQGEETVPRILVGCGPFYAGAEDLVDATILSSEMASPLPDPDAGDDNFRRFDVRETF